MGAGGEKSRHEGGMTSRQPSSIAASIRC